MAEVHVLAEGELDARVAERLLQNAGHTVGKVYGRRGSSYIRQRVRSFYHAYHELNTRLFTLADAMDLGTECAGEIRQSLLLPDQPDPLFRLAVPEIEAWLLADSRGFAGFLGIPAAKIPTQVESLADPKQLVMTLARLSRSKWIRDALVPIQGSRAVQGPAYNSVLSDFVLTKWKPEDAAAVSISLRRAMARISEIQDP